MLGINNQELLLPLTLKETAGWRSKEGKNSSKILPSSPVKKLRSIYRVLSSQVSLISQESYLIDAGNLSLILNVGEVEIKQWKSEQSVCTDCVLTQGSLPIVPCHLHTAEV